MLDVLVEYTLVHAVLFPLTGYHAEGPQIILERNGVPSKDVHGPIGESASTELSRRRSLTREVHYFIANSYLKVFGILLYFLFP